MKANDFIPYLGKTDASAAIKKLLKELDAKPPKLKRDDNDAWVTRKSEGVALIFEPVGKKGALELVDVQLYRGGTDGYKPFTGALPSGLAFTDSRTAARKKLGKPDAAGTELDVDSWDHEDHTLVLEYADDRKAIGMIHVQKPFNEDEDD